MPRRTRQSHLGSSNEDQTVFQGPGSNDIDHTCCDSLLIAKAAVALNTRRGGLKAKRDGVDVEDYEGSVQGYQEQEYVQ